jgi:hypothetical protein
MKTTYILVEFFKQKTKKFVTDKTIRFQTGISPSLIRGNNEGEVIISFHEDPTGFILDEGRLEIYIKR